MNIDQVFLAILIVVLILLLFKMTKMIAPYVPSHGRDLSRIKKLVEKYQINSVLDLGCGPGGIINYLSNQNPAGKFRGIEISPLLCTIAKLRFVLKKNVTVSYGNCFNHDWGGYDSLFMFWLPQSFVKYESKIKKKLIPGQYIISYTFPIEWLADKLLEIDRPEKQLPIYVYKI